MKVEHKTTVLILVAVLLLAIILVVYGFTRSGLIGNKAGTPPPPASTIPPPTFAAQGQLTPGFPSALILDPGAAVKSSYSIDYSSGAKQYTAEWVSTSSVATLFSRYLAYASTTGWTIQNEDLQNSAVRGLYATDGSSTLSVAVVSQAGGNTQVTIGYLAAQ